MGVEKSNRKGREAELYFSKYFEQLWLSFQEEKHTGDMLIFENPTARFQSTYAPLRGLNIQEIKYDLGHVWGNGRVETLLL